MSGTTNKNEWTDGWGKIANVFNFIVKYIMKGRMKMELKDTVELMNSSDYKERFKAEYQQTKIRYDKLCTMLIKNEAGTLGFEPTCSLDILEDQKYHMEQYLRSLRVRAELEKIDLN